MDISKFLAKVIGIYLIIVSIAFFINMGNMINVLKDLINDVPLMFVTGFFTLILGILMVVSHNIWQLNWRVIITIISWLTFLKGASIILYPYIIDKITFLFIQNGTFAYISIGFDFVIGILLSYCGFKSYKK